MKLLYDCHQLVPRWQCRRGRAAFLLQQISSSASLKKDDLMFGWFGRDDDYPGRKNTMIKMTRGK